MRCVFDTNILVSASISDSKPRAALDFAQQNGQVLISLQAFAELREVLSRKWISKYIAVEDVERFIDAVARAAEWVYVEIHIAACRDPKDDMFLELAVSGNATHIITGDFDLLALDPYENIRIVTPHDFLEQTVNATP